MHVIVERNRFLKMLRITTDRKDRRMWLYDTSFLRLEAVNDRLRICGKTVEAEFPAAVISTGVLFIRARRFFELMQVAPDGQELTMRMEADGMHFGDVTAGWENGDALLYVDPNKAPERHPEEPPRPQGEVESPPAQTGLFGD